VVKPTSDSHFAWIRTRLSADSTLMGWMRLATTLIGFGFTILQFFDRLETMSSAKPALAPHLPRYLGLALIFSGVFGLLIAIWQYIWFVNYLHSEEFSRLAIKPTLPINRPALAIAIALALVGTVAFVTVMFRLS
jgi:putative membrane protein